jgi:hypothetical protein
MRLQEDFNELVGLLNESGVAFWTADKAQNPKSAKTVMTAVDKASGDEIGIKVHGKWFSVKYGADKKYYIVGRGSFGLTSANGTRKEMEAIVKYVIKHGELPGFSSGW